MVRLELPGFGHSPMLAGEVTVAAYADAVEAHLPAEGMQDTDLVGSSLVARLVVEMARRGLRRSTASLDPDGTWTAPQKKVFGASLAASVALVRTVEPALPTLLATMPPKPVGRIALLAQLSARPWAPPAHFVLSELPGLADAPGSTPAIKALASGPDQQGGPAGSLPGPRCCWCGASRTG